jgi:hypothetical protein
LASLDEREAAHNDVPKALSNLLYLFNTSIVEEWIVQDKLETYVKNVGSWAWKNTERVLETIKDAAASIGKESLQPSLEYAESLIKRHWGMGPIAELPAIPRQGLIKAFLNAFVHTVFDRIDSYTQAMMRMCLKPTLEKSYKSDHIHGKAREKRKRSGSLERNAKRAHTIPIVVRHTAEV